MRRSALLLGSLALALATATAQETVAYKAHRIIASPTRTFPDGVLLVREGRIVSVGTRLPIPAGARVVDCKDKTIAPGLVDTWSQLSVGGEGTESARAFTPDLRISDALDLTDRKWKVLPLVGVTSVLVGPAPSQVAGGMACLVKIGKEPRVVDSAVSLQLSLAGDARNQERPPTSLPGQVRLLHNAFGRAAKAGKEGRNSSCPATAVLAKALAGDVMTGIFCTDANEIQAAARLAVERKLQGFLVAPPGCRRIPEILAPTGMGAILLPADREPVAWQLRLPGKLAAAGVTVAFGSGMPRSTLLSFRSRAARAIRYGMKKADAFAAMTSNPARLVGLSHMIGTLERGRDADFIVLDGHPLNPGSRISATYVEGNPVYRVRPGKEAGK